MTVLALGAVAVAVGGYLAWENLMPQPVLRIDSPVETQTVAAGASLQVWVSGEDILGVQSMTLTLDPAGSQLVQSAPTPALFNFQKEQERPAAKSSHSL